MLAFRMGDGEGRLARGQECMRRRSCMWIGARPRPKLTGSAPPAGTKLSSSS
jgi:hypothetical protein